ncbi:hypothetical protein AX16_001145 [Volvariella volvacea WC 439]|nr:hypothetical protein AX16_001145 [Volvariella volvacea WC 439]
MISPSLANSPPDIILSIAEHLDLSTLCQLRLLSHEFDAQFSALALRSIAFRLCNDEEKVQQLLDACSQPLPCIYRHAKHLTVKTSGWVVSRAANSTRIVDLYKTIGRLERLKSFKVVWEFEHGWDESEATRDFIYEIQERVVEAVLKVTGGTLNQLTIKPKIIGKHRFALPTRLGEFKGLRELHVVFDKYGNSCSGLDRWGQISEWYGEEHDCKPEGYEEVLQGLIRNNSGLQVLDLQKGCGIEFSDAAELFLSDDERHLSSLQKLTVSGVRFSPTLKTQSFPFARLQHLEVPSIYSILSLDHFWPSLQTAGAKLKILKTHQVSLSLVAYLASYSGLQQLTIKDIESLPTCTDSEVPAMFFNDALPRHGASLKELCISFYANISFLDGWSFTPKLWVPALPSLVALRSLYLHPGDQAQALRLQGQSQATTGLNSDDDDEDEAIVEIEDEHSKLVRHYQEILDHVGSLPNLEFVSILWTRHFWGRGTGRIRWAKRSRATLAEVVKELRSENGVPKQLALFRMLCDAKKNEESGESGWEYVRNSADK